MGTARQIVQSNIKRLVDLEGSPKAFGDKVGATKQAVNNWINEGHIPDIERIAEIAHLYGLTLADMLTDEEGRTPTHTPSFVKVPLYGSVAAGVPIEMIEDYEIKEAPARFLEDDPDCFLVRINGNSETRRGLFDGDYALVSPKYKEPTPGDLFLVAVNGDEATIKEIVVLENGVELVPDSYDPTYERQLYNFNDADTPSVTNMGKIVWHCAAF